MYDPDAGLRQPGPRGCLASLAGFAVLAVMSPFALLVHAWRRWRRGDDVRVVVEATERSDTEEGAARVEVTVDLPRNDEGGFRRRATDAVIRVAESLRRPDDVYNLIYRTPADDEALALPVGPLLQELGERFFLTLNQGSLDGRTLVWLTLGRGTALAEVVDPATCNPEADGEPEGLLATPEARWAMASEWALVGPSLVIRLIFVVPSTSSQAVCDSLRALQVTRDRRHVERSNV